MAYDPIIDFYDEPGGPNGGYKGGGSGGGGGGGTRVELFNETVTTEGSDGMNRGLVFGNGTTADKVYVTFDGTEYELPRVQFPGGDDYGYGAFGETGPDFSTYPLMLSYSEEGEGWFVFTETAGTYTIAAYTVSGGGGGVALGGKQYTPTYTCQPPTVGDNLDNISEFYVKSLYVGDQQVLFPEEDDQAQVYNYNTIIALAAGSKATLVTRADESPETTAYVVKIGSRPTDLGSESFLESVTPWDGEYTESYDDQQFFLSLTVTIPELDCAGGEMLLFYFAEG